MTVYQQTLVDSDHHPDPIDDRTVAATILQGIKSDLRSLDSIPRSAIDMADLTEVDELVSRLWRPRQRSAA